MYQCSVSRVRAPFSTAHVVRPEYVPNTIGSGVVVGGVVVVGGAVVVPSTGKIHTANVVAAVTVEYVPCGHAVHDVADSVVDYLP